MRGKREKNQPHHQSQEDPLFDTGYDQIEFTIPSVISTPTDAISQREMLRNSRPKKRSNSGMTEDDVPSGLSVTQQAFLASDENGIIVTSNRRSGIDHHSPSRSSRPGRVQASYADPDDSSTLPTCVSVGESIDLQQGCKLQQERTDTTFLVSKEEGSDEQQPTLLKLVSLEPSSQQSNDKGFDHDTRKRLHYKEKLRSLTNRFLTSPAVGRSKEMLSDIIDRGTNSASNATIVVPKEDHNTTNDHAKQTVRINRNSQFDKLSVQSSTPPQEKSGESLERIITKIGQAFSACSMCICLDDAVVNHEGRVIHIPNNKKKGYDDCMCAGDILHSKNDGSCCSSTNEESTSAWTDISSMTGSTPYRYQKRYWLDSVPKDDMQWI